MGNAIDRAKGAVFAGHHVSVFSERAGDERANPRGIAESDQILGGEDRTRISATHSSHDLGDGGLRAVFHLVNKNAGQNFAVAGGVKNFTARFHLFAKFLCVDQVAVMGNGNISHQALAVDGLGVSKNARASG